MSRARDLADSADNDISGTLTVDDITLSGNITVGGTVDGRDLATDGSKLDGVEANATADQTGAEIKAAYEGETDTNAYTDAEKTKLSGIETGATADQTITAGSGLTGGGTGDVTISHADTSSVSNSDNSGNTFIQDLTFDGYGHVTAVGTGTVSVGDGTLTVQGTGALGGSGTFTANQSANTTISISHDDTSSQSSVDNSGATVIQDVTLDGYGHVTGLGSKTMTLADLGYTGATNANYITNNNQLTNGAGYSTYSANQSLDTTSSPTFSNPNLTSALRMGGTQVLSSGRALTNITSVDSTTATAIGNAGVGGGSVYEYDNVFGNTHSAYTKPADGVVLNQGSNFFVNLALYNGTTSFGEKSGRGPSTYRAFSTSALTSSQLVNKYGKIVMKLPSASISLRSGGYYGSLLFFTAYNSSTNKTRILAQYGGWPSQTILPKELIVDHFVVTTGWALELYVSDAYDQAIYNENLTFSANTISCVGRFLQV